MRMRQSMQRMGDEHATLQASLIVFSFCRTRWVFVNERAPQHPFAGLLVTWNHLGKRPIFLADLIDSPRVVFSSQNILS